MKVFSGLLLVLFLLTAPGAHAQQASCSAATADCKRFVGTRVGGGSITPEKCDAAGAQCRRACKNGKSVFVGPHSGSPYPTNSCG